MRKITKNQTVFFIVIFLSLIFTPLILLVLKVSRRADVYGFKKGAIKRMIGRMQGVREKNSGVDVSTLEELQVALSPEQDKILVSQLWESNNLRHAMERNSEEYDIRSCMYSEEVTGVKICNIVHDTSMQSTKKLKRVELLEILAKIIKALDFLTIHIAIVIEKWGNPDARDLLDDQEITNETIDQIVHKVFNKDTPRSITFLAELEFLSVSDETFQLFFSINSYTTIYTVSIETYNPELSEFINFLRVEHICNLVIRQLGCVLPEHSATTSQSGSADKGEEPELDPESRPEKKELPKVVIRNLLLYGEIPVARFPTWLLTNTFENIRIGISMYLKLSRAEQQAIKTKKIAFWDILDFLEPVLSQQLDVSSKKKETNTETVQVYFSAEKMQISKSLDEIKSELGGIKYFENLIAWSLLEFKSLKRLHIGLPSKVAGEVLETYKHAIKISVSPPHRSLETVGFFFNSDKLLLRVFREEFPDKKARNDLGLVVAAEILEDWVDNKVLDKLADQTFRDVKNLSNTTGKPSETKPGKEHNHDNVYVQNGNNRYTLENGVEILFENYITPCGHLICFGCFLSDVQSRELSKHPPLCPFCNEPIKNWKFYNMLFQEKAGKYDLLLGKTFKRWNIRLPVAENEQLGSID